jgi:hypothetical protein
MAVSPQHKLCMPFLGSGLELTHGWQIAGLPPHPEGARFTSAPLAGRSDLGWCGLCWHESPDPISGRGWQGDYIKNL